MFVVVVNNSIFQDGCYLLKKREKSITKTHQDFDY